MSWFVQALHESEIYNVVIQVPFKDTRTKAIQRN